MPIRIENPHTKVQTNLHPFNPWSQRGIPTWLVSESDPIYQEQREVTLSGGWRVTLVSDKDGDRYITPDGREVSLEPGDKRKTIDGDLITVFENRKE